MWAVASVASSSGLALKPDPVCRHQGLERAALHCLAWRIYSVISKVADRREEAKEPSVSAFFTGAGRK